MTFHGKERMDEHTREHLHESPWVVTLPLIALAIPSIAIGWLTVGPRSCSATSSGGAIAQAPRTTRSRCSSEEFHGPAAFVLHALESPAVYLALAGVVAAWYLYLKRPELPAADRCALTAACTRLLVNKYYFDWFNENVIASGSAELRHEPVEARRRDRRSTAWLVNGTRALGALVGHRAPRAVRLPLSLCLRDDHRPCRCCSAGCCCET